MVVIKNSKKKKCIGESFPLYAPTTALFHVLLVICRHVCKPSQHIFTNTYELKTHCQLRPGTNIHSHSRGRRKSDVHKFITHKHVKLTNIPVTVRWYQEVRLEITHNYSHWTGYRLNNLGLVTFISPFIHSHIKYEIQHSNILKENTFNIKHFPFS